MKKAAKDNQVGMAKGKAVKIKKVKKELKPEGAESKQNLGKFKRGGAAKHKTQVNVIVGAGQKQPMPMPVPMGGPPMQPPVGGPPPMAPRPGMKTGGAVKSAPKFKGGAGGGLGRLEKAEDAKKIK